MCERRNLMRRFIPATPVVLFVASIEPTRATAQTPPSLHARPRATWMAMMAMLLALGGPSPLKAQAVPVGPLVSAGALWPELCVPFSALGDRLQNPGKDRVTFTGTITRVDQGNVSYPIRLVWEFPGKIRLDEQITGGNHTF